MHTVNWIHRDMKLENVLVQYDSNNKVTLKIADFGFAIAQQGKVLMQLGSPLYIAPEIIKSRPYDEKVDIWSFGVMVFYMLTKHWPFGNDALTKEEVYGEIKNDTPEFDLIKNKKARAFVERCLIKNPKKRATA